MGYNTEFFGAFAVFPKLKEKHQRYLTAFSDTRRVKRSGDGCADTLREAVDLPAGVDGGNVVANDSIVISNDHPPTGQPGLWCDWSPTHGGEGIAWNGTEKFYRYVEWLQYLLDNFLVPWGYTLSGQVFYAGENPFDRGIIEDQGDRAVAKATPATCWQNTE